MEYCLADAGAKGKSGVCMLGAQKQKAWLSDQSFAKKYGFQVVDTAAGGYELLALSFDGTAPRFTDAARRGTIPEQELTIYYGMQCPYIHASLEQVKRFCGERGAPVTLIPVDSLHRAKELPGVFNNWAVFYRGRLETVNLLDEAGLKRLLSK